MPLKRLRALAVGLAVGGVLVGAASLPAHAAKAVAPLMSMPEPVRDLYYGDALFYFFQDDYFKSLVHLDAAISQGRVTHHQTEAELLKGALYLSLGQHVEAGRIFRSLLNDNVAPDVRDRAWFYLGKLWYQRGYYPEAEQALNSISGSLPASLETERRMLSAQVLLNQGRFDEAINALQAIDAGGSDSKHRVDSNWAPYARFNLGVALVRQNRMDEAVKLLDAVGEMDAPTEELLALRDKANLALGFSWLKQGRTADAEQVLQRVRLIGPQSNKALLGLGWAQSAEGKYSEALVPWLELKQRDLLDAAVQEAYLAIPFAYAQLKSDGQAAQYYNFAIDSFHQESARIEQSISAIRSGSLITTVLANDRTDQSGWYWQLRNLPDAPETRYLYDLLASNTFQEALKNYRDLKLMQINLQNWTQSMDAFQNMVDTRQLAYEQRTAAMKQVLDDVDMDALEAKVLDNETRLKQIEREEDVVTLATFSEQTLWRRVNRLQDAAAKGDPSDPAVAEMQDKIRLMRGSLYWNMSVNFKARLWREQKEVRELAVATKEARRRYTLVGRARNAVPERNEQFAARVAELTPRLQTLVARCNEVSQAQTDHLSQLAIEQLQQQKERLAQYTLQAQFALASIYDRAADGHDDRPAKAADGATP